MERGGERDDVVGAVLALAFGAWLLLVGALRSGNPYPGLGTLVLAIAAYTAGRLVGPRGAGRLGRLVALTVVGVEVAAVAATYAGDRDPDVTMVMGYDNADAAWLVQAAAAAALVVALAHGRSRRTPWLVLIGVVAIGVGVRTTVASAAAAGGVLLCALAVAAGRPRRAGPWVAAALLLVTLVVAATAAVSAPQLGSGLREQAASLLSERRVALWTDAGTIIAHNPVMGVGPGRFREVSRTAHDPDTPYAHSLLLEQAAESGLPGAVLLGALLAWGVLRVRRVVSRAALPAAVAVASWLAFGLTSAVDYVAQFPIVAATAALVLGTATGAALRDR